VSEKPTATAPRTVALRVAAVLACLAGAGAIVLYPSSAAIAEGHIVNRAIEALPFSPALGADVGAGELKLALPDGSSLSHDERSQRKIYRFARELDLGMWGKRRVAFELTGYPPGKVPGKASTLVLDLKRAVPLDIEYRAPRPGWKAEYYEPKQDDVRPFGVVIQYEETATDPVAMHALIGRILDSFQAVRL
jgi:hypothetical protein